MWRVRAGNDDGQWSEWSEVRYFDVEPLNTDCSDYISNISLDPETPATLQVGQEVHITFDYATNEAGGVRIFVRPYTDGSRTPNYAAHSSPLYPVGSGTGTGWFTIESGNVMVDQLEFSMFNADQSLLLVEYFIPVEYHFWYPVIY